ncbi:MAG: family 20 glycosylhydrolase [Verrucomicrobiota bacterium]
MNLLPYPRSLKRQAGNFILPKEQPLLGIAWVRSAKAPDHPEGYLLTIDRRGVRIEYRETGGLLAAGATLRQLLREYGRRLPCLKIRDWPDFARRGVMLDISRGRVPKLETLLDLVERLADFKINEFQLYTEHTFAYRRYKSVWQSWGALTAAEIRTLDARCRELGIDLVPNQNSFGHLRYFLEHPKVKQLAEVSAPYEGSTGDFLRFPTTLAPNHPGTIKFIRELYDELLPNFSSKFLNVGCDETWDLGRGQSKKLCERRGKGRVYVDFLKQIQREAAKRGCRMMFWGDIILHHPELIPELASLGVPPSGGSGRPPKGGTPNLIALNWGYEATHPFEKEAATFAKSKVPFYVCPGTATWMTLLGRHDTAFANLKFAAAAGRKHGAIGYLNTDWGDGGHPQPLAVSWPLYVIGAAHSWCSKSFDEKLLRPVLSRDVYEDPTQDVAKAAIALGFAHRKFDYLESNVTPFGAVIAAPPPETRELFCRSGLKYYARIKPKNIQAALVEVEKQRTVLAKTKSSSKYGVMLKMELELAARMAAQSCHIMLWQQALAAGKTGEAKRLARAGIKALLQIENTYNACWPWRNKATPVKSSSFLKWRRDDYKRGKVHFPPEVARVAKAKTYAAE